MLFVCFLVFLEPTNAKKHSKSTLWGTPRQVPKIAQKALRGALSGPGPKSTPVNGGQDRKTRKRKMVLKASDFHLFLRLFLRPKSENFHLFCTAYIALKLPLQLKRFSLLKGLIFAPGHWTFCTKKIASPKFSPKMPPKLSLSPQERA